MVEVQKISSKNMEEKSAEVRLFTHHKMADMEEKATYMACEMRRKTHCMKAEMKEVKTEEYECLARGREKEKHECHIRKTANQRCREFKRRLKRS